MRKFLFLLALVACSTSTDPKPTPVVARLEFKSHALIAFSGRRMPLYSMFTAYDSVGRVIVHPNVQVDAPAGWVRLGDTLVAPSGESRGNLRVSAPSGVSASSNDMSSLVVLPGDIAVITSVYDFRGFSWKATYMCRSDELNTVVDNGVELDSAQYVVSADTIMYPEDSLVGGWMVQHTTTSWAQMPWAGYAIRWLRDGTRDSVARSGTTHIIRQLPDSIYFRVATPSNVIASWQSNPAIRSNPGHSPRRYFGGSWCSPELWLGNSTPDPMVFEQR
jgi:hypothetical protein